MKEKTVLVSGAVVYKRNKGEKPCWFIIKQNSSSNWEIPKTIVRRGESSVRAVIRLMAEQAGMRAKVLEEVGRGSSSTTIAGKVVSSKQIYYLMVCKDQGEVLGYEESDWVPYSDLSRKLGLKREKSIYKSAKEILAGLDRERKKVRKVALLQQKNLS
jgi:ADP-ribose pyrophosphatase YjhB (NUDIX family)